MPEFEPHRDRPAPRDEEEVDETGAKDFLFGAVGIGFCALLAIVLAIVT